MKKLEFSESITKKVFTKDNLLNLLELISKNWHETDEKDWLSSEYISVDVKTSDGISAQYDKIDITELDGLLETKKIDTLSVNYRKRITDSTLRVSLDVTQFGSSRFSVSSEDSEWFNAKRTEVTDFLNGIKPQTNFYLNHRTTVLSALALYIGFTFLMVLTLLITFVQRHYGLESTPLDPSSPKAKFLSAFKYPILFAGSYAVGFMPALLLRDIIDKLWPNIEFDFGPVHLNKTRRRREIIKYIITIIVLPIIIALIMELIF